jgi:hypothetical protein
MNIIQLYYELCIVGMKVIILPALVVAGCLILVFLTNMNAVSRGLGLTVLVEIALPLLAGLHVIDIAGSDPAVELQLSLPTSYLSTTIYRQSLVWGGTSWIALCTSIVALLPFTVSPIMIADWPPLLRLSIWQLTWFAPLLLFMALGHILILLLRSQAASSVLLCGIWLGDLFMTGFLAGKSILTPLILFMTTLVAQSPFWLLNRCVLLCFACLIWIAAGQLLIHREVQL